MRKKLWLRKSWSRSVRMLALLALCGLTGAARADEMKPNKNGKFRVAVAGYYGDTNSGLVADQVSAAFARSTRFEVYERSQMQIVMDEKRLAELFGDPREAKKLRGIVPVDYLVYGRISASCPVVRNSSYDKKKRKYSYTYNATATVSISHRITEVATGKLVQQQETVGSKSAYSQYGEPDPAALIASALQIAAKKFAKSIGINDDAQGSIQKLLSDGQVMINLGSDDGVATDVDLSVVRIMPQTDSEGKPLVVSGEVVTKIVPFGPENKPKDLCVARPVRVEKDYCIADIGYNSRGSFMGSKKFKKSADHFAAIKVGDVVVLTARPDEVD